MDKDLLPIKLIREILSQISLGVYRHGHRLPAERKLCQQFGVSRGTLRRALEDLEKMGAIQIRPQSGAYVQKMPKSGLSERVLPKDIATVTLREIIVARKAIELAAVELACERITKSDLKALEKCIDHMQTNVDNLPEYLQFDIGFHEQIVKASKNPALIAAFEAISDYHKYSQVFSSSSDACETDAIKHHRCVVAALGEGNASKSAAALRRHFDCMLKQED
jgi:GntR family transcriptional regulator, transcriptional repressor for pyruvate dehydrogenase complex